MGTVMGTVRRSGAYLALAGYLALHLHVLVHVFGQEAKERAHAAPCSICVAVLGHRTLAAAKLVSAPRVPVLVSMGPARRLRLPLWTAYREVDSRGPPVTLPICSIDPVPPTRGSTNYSVPRGLYV
jgi:hypothetical protein